VVPDHICSIPVNDRESRSLLFLRFLLGRLGKGRGRLLCPFLFPRTICLARRTRVWYLEAGRFLDQFVFEAMMVMIRETKAGNPDLNFHNLCMGA
jgi:hypothetical protein